ncbi:hypothetical protein NC652_037696 [Populus alba x Populus x berolinensis]|nr:hypothetical protein NC652_037696 [Populus alba x Populus x berolinensis]
MFPCSRKCLLNAITLFVCIVASEACETDDDESGVIIKFKLPTGIHVDDDDATSWDSFK